MANPSEFGVRLGGSLTSESYAFQACLIDRSSISPALESTTYSKSERANRVIVP
jgi:hypothetical protein